MGVGIGTLEFLLEAAERGVRFERTATIGRQGLFMRPRAVAQALARHGFRPSDDLRADPGWLEPVLTALGARETVSIDASPYEGATVVHDLNRPLPADLEQRFSAVFDGGSLEHIFNVAAALESYMRMVEVGGHLLITTMANNCLGHGFYQFSPELFFRVLSPANGFETERIVVVENDVIWRWALGRLIPFERIGRFYEVADPAAVRSRVLLENRRPLVIHVQARRVADVPLLVSPPQQSDYAEILWSETPHTPDPAAALRARLRRRVARPLSPALRSAVQTEVVPRALSVLKPVWFWREARGRSLRNRRFFKPAAHPRGARSLRGRSLRARRGGGRGA